MKPHRYGYHYQKQYELPLFLQPQLKPRRSKRLFVPRKPFIDQLLDLLLAILVLVAVGLYGALLF